MAQPDRPTTDPAHSPHVHAPQASGDTLARRRPVGMVLIAALLLFNLIGALTSFVAALMGPGTPAMMAAYFLILTLVLGALLYGFWTFRRWGWMGVVALTAVGIALALAQFIAMVQVAVMVGNLVGAVIGGLVLWYLFQPGVRGRFDR